MSQFEFFTVAGEFEVVQFFVISSLKRLSSERKLDRKPNTIIRYDVLMDHLHYRLNFDLNKSRQKFHHSLKEHHKIRNIPKFLCEML